MKTLKLLLLLTLVSFLSDGPCFSASEENLPKIGFVKNDDAQVRAGDNINFEPLCNLAKGDPVKIIDKRYSWFKITLPKKAHIYIKNDYVDISQQKDIGEVIAQSVNLRAGPGTKYSIMGQVSEPEIVTVVSEKDGWYEIEPPQGTAGWIHSNDMVFSIKNIPETIKSDTAAQEKSIQQETTPQDKAVKKSGKTGTVNLQLSPTMPNTGNLTFSTKD